MKRFIVILAVLLPALTGRAQDVEMFQIEQSHDVPGINQHRLYERATSWFVWSYNNYDTIYDYVTDPMGQAIELVFRDVPAGSRYRNVTIKFRIAIVSKEQGYRVSLDRLFVTCYMGRRTIFCINQMPEIAEGYFPDDRLLQDRLHICGMAQDFARERFNELLPSVRKTMENYPVKFDFVQE